MSFEPRFSKELNNTVNEEVEVVVSSNGGFIEIWQGTDLVEFEIEKIPAFINLLNQASTHGWKSE